MLKMDVAIPAPGMDHFDFNDARPVPFFSVPSSPTRFGDYSYSTPSSPSRMTEFYRYFEDFSGEESPFHREEKPAGNTPKSPRGAAANKEDDFAFSFKVELEKDSLSADELFDGGKIRPLQPPPRLQGEERTPLLGSPIAQGKKIIHDVFSSRRKKDSDPNRTENERGRGRGRDSELMPSASRRATRSLSPFRVAEYPWEEEERQLQKINKQPSLESKTSSKASSRKWRLKDLLLFRSASEGRATDKDRLRNYPAFFRKQEDVNSVRSTESANSSSGTRTRKGRVSAHELHYTTNKAVSEDLKKKTFLPYKQGILGRLAFNPTTHARANGFGSFTRN